MLIAQEKLISSSKSVGYVFEDPELMVGFVAMSLAEVIYIQYVVDMSLSEGCHLHIPLKE